MALGANYVELRPRYPITWSDRTHRHESQSRHESRRYSVRRRWSWNARSEL